MVLHNAFDYACESDVLTVNPLGYVNWTRKRPVSTVDPRVVINGEQARRFLDAVEQHSERGARLKAFFGCMYYAGLRPKKQQTSALTTSQSCPKSPASGVSCI